MVIGKVEKVHPQAQACLQRGELSNFVVRSLEHLQSCSARRKDSADMICFPPIVANLAVTRVASVKQPCFWRCPTSVVSLAAPHTSLAERASADGVASWAEGCTYEIDASK